MTPKPNNLRHHDVRGTGLLQRLRGKEYLFRVALSLAGVMVIVLCLSLLLNKRQKDPLMDYLARIAEAHKEAREPPSTRLQKVVMDFEDILGELLDPGRVLLVPRREYKRTVLRPGLNSAEATTSDPGQLALREAGLSELILYLRDLVTEKEAWQVIRQIPGDRSYRRYEELRILNEMLVIQYEREIDRLRVLKELKLTSAEAAASPLHNYEDLQHAGSFALLNGDSEGAIGYLERAAATWPAPGSARGNVHLYLMLAYAAEDDSKMMFPALDRLKLMHPDWRYPEIYLPDIDEIAATFKDKALVIVVRAKVQQMTNNYAGAYADLIRAQRIGLPDPYSRLIVAMWLKTIEVQKQRSEQ